MRIKAITRKELDEVVRRKEAEPEKRFGEIAIELGYINDEAIDRYLDSRGRASSSLDPDRGG